MSVAAVPTSPGVTLTDQQGRALRVPDASVALSAGAGCGKTMVLTERFLAALDDGGGRPLQALVALTFTEKAARELRQRIRARCRSKLAAGDDPGWWWTVLRGLDAAPIGTFHEFCARLLRRHAMQAGVDPEFAILDESIAGSLREEAVRIALRKLLAARDADLIDLGTDYGLRQVREALGRLASMRGTVGLEEWARQDPEAIVKHWRAMAENRLWPTVLDRASPLTSHCRRLLERLDSDAPKIRDRRAALLDALRLLDPGAPPCPADRLDELVALMRVSDLPRAASWPSEEIYEALKTTFTDLREHIKKYVSPALGWDDADSLLATAGRGLRFARLALAVRREHERLKRRRRGLDFDDLLVMARDLLRDHPELAAPEFPEAGSPAIEFVLVDEFQDTDAIQGEILRLLSGAAFRTGRLFVVGDVKQSIYRFRGAEPGIFRDWRSEFPARGRLSLTENFRSVPGIIGFVNALFGDCFRELDPSAPDDPGPGTGAANAGIAAAGETPPNPPFARGGKKRGGPPPFSPPYERGGQGGLRAQPRPSAPNLVGRRSVWRSSPGPVECPSADVTGSPARGGIMKGFSDLHAPPGEALRSPGTEHCDAARGRSTGPGLPGPPGT
jgi:ATP-dependent helicase/nuclease subunit A